jgi:predicted transcriptional regulator
VAGKPFKVTKELAGMMMADRRAGMTTIAIAAKYGVTLQTVSRHTSEASAKAIRRRDREKYQKIKADPDRWQAYRQKKSEYEARYRGSQR